MQIEDQFVKKKIIIQRTVEYEQEISKIFTFWFDLIVDGLPKTNDRSIKEGIKLSLFVKS